MHLRYLSSLVLLSSLLQQVFASLSSSIPSALLSRASIYDAVALEGQGGNAKQILDYGGTYNVGAYPGNEEFVLESQKKAQQILDTHADLRKQDPKTFKKENVVITASHQGDEYKIAHQGRPQNDISLSQEVKDKINPYLIAERAPLINHLEIESERLKTEAEQAQKDANDTRNRYKSLRIGDESRPSGKDVNEAFKTKDDILEQKKEIDDRKRIFENPTHRHEEKCSECKIATENGGNQQGARQVSFKGDANGKAVPVPPCSGNGRDLFGCKELQIATGAEDLYEKAKVLCTRDEYGEWPTSAKFRRAIACALPPRVSPMESKKATPASSKPVSSATAEPSASVTSMSITSPTSARSTSFNQPTSSKASPKSASTKPTESNSGNKSKAIPVTGPLITPKAKKPADASALSGH